MWNLAGPGIEPVSPALAGRFLSALPPEKSHVAILDRVVRGDRAEKVTFAPRVKGIDGDSRIII